MKHLKKFENFENIPVAKYELEDNQVDDLHEQFELFVEDMENDRGEAIPHSELKDIFSVDDKGEISDDFVRFLDYLEANTEWFDYKMMDKVKNDLAIIVAKMGIDYEDEDEDDFEWAQDDPEWPYEKEEGEQGEMLAHEDEDDDDEIEQLRQKTYSKSPEMNIDEILDKINDLGYDSLTDEEKEFLSKQESKKILGFKRFKS
jgi:hypothetical protein